MAIEKIKILGVDLELPAIQPCQFSPFIAKMGQMVWIGCADERQLQNGSQDFIFSIAMGADYSFEEKNIEIWKDVHRPYDY